MTNHDQLFKLLLQTFFREFLEVFVPRIYRAMEPAHIHFLDKELIRAQGAQRKTKLVDLVARVRLADKDGFVMVHIEHQARRARDLGRRMFLYAAWLMQRYGLPVYPVLVASYAQPRDAEPDRYRMEIRGFRVLEFRYRVVQLNRLRWRAYARFKNPAATALLAKMRIEPKDRVKVKLQVLRLMATLRLEPAKMDLIAGFMETYLALTAKEELAFQQAVLRIQDSKEKQSVMELMTSWERKGRQEGRQEGRLATIKRQLRVLTRNLTPPMEKEIDRLGEAELADLAEALLSFSSTRDLDRWLHEHRG
jgi:predicted transposase YdaD